MILHHVGEVLKMRKEHLTLQKSTGVKPTQCRTCHDGNVTYHNIYF